MYNLLVKLMVISALLQLGISFSDLFSGGNGSIFKRVDGASKKVLKIDWKPISVFPEEAKKSR